MASQFGNLPPGAAPFAPRPASPRGLYRTFGMPERLLRIHFPKKDDTATAQPWYWFIEKQQPYSFCYLAPPTWGPGWVRIPDFPVIKILAIDTQPIVPMPKIGSNTLEDAVRKVADADGLFGRFDYNDDHFWALLDIKKPKFHMQNGLAKARDKGQNLKAQIQQAVKLFETHWNDDAKDYNGKAASIGTVDGFHYEHVHGHFAIAQPDGPPATFAGFAQQFGDFFKPLPLSPNARYLSSLPVTACFNFNTITTYATAYTMKVGQLDAKKWNMGVFPPIEAGPGPSVVNGQGSTSAKSGNYSGFGGSAVPFFNQSDFG